MSSIKCPQCNLTNWSTATNCKRCQYSFQAVEESTEFAYQENSADQINSHNHNPHQSHSQTYQGYDTPGQNYYQPNGQYANHQQANYGYYQPANLKSGLAIASMVLGILSFVTAMFLLGIVLAPIGLILGIVALVKANKKPFVYGGKAFAIVGIVLSSMIVVFIPIVAAIAIPNLLAARRSANEGSAISSMRVLASAEATYIATAGAGKCGDLQDLSKAGLIDSALAVGQKSGYKFAIAKIPYGNNRCEITAVPAVTKGVSATGIRSFYIATDENVIRAANKSGLLADKNDAPLDSFDSGYPNSSRRPPQVSSRGSNDY